MTEKKTNWSRFADESILKMERVEFREAMRWVDATDPERAERLRKERKRRSVAAYRTANPETINASKRKWWAETGSKRRAQARQDSK